MSVETLSVPLLYGQPVNIQVFSTFLYKNGLQSINPDYGVLGAASAIILVVTIGLVALQAKLLKDAQRFVSVRGKATRPRLLDLGWLKWISLCAIVFYVVMGALLPIVGLSSAPSPWFSPRCSRRSRRLTMDNYERIFTFETYIQSIKNSLIVAGARRGAGQLRGAAGRDGRPAVDVPVPPRGGISGAGTAGHARHHRRHRALLGVRLPARSGSGQLIQGTLWALIIGFGLRALPSGFGSLAPSVMQIGQELDNAARVAGRRLGEDVRPRSWCGCSPRPSLGALILTFVTMLKEYSPAMFLASANSNIIGTTMLELWVQGNTGSVAALASHPDRHHRSLRGASRDFS